jgi:hypothetical protein
VSRSRLRELACVFGSARLEWASGKPGSDQTACEPSNERRARNVELLRDHHRRRRQQSQRPRQQRTLTSHDLSRVVRFDSRCILVPESHWLSSSPNDLPLPLWKKKPLTSRHRAQVRSTSPRASTRISHAPMISFTSKQRFPSRDALQVRPLASCLVTRERPSPTSLSTTPLRRPQRCPLPFPAKTALRSPYRHAASTITPSPREIHSRDSSQRREQPQRSVTVSLENFAHAAPQIRFGPLKLFQLVFPQRTQPRRRFWPRDHRGQSGQMMAIDRGDRDFVCGRRATCPLLGTDTDTDMNGYHLCHPRHPESRKKTKINYSTTLSESLAIDSAHSLTIRIDAMPGRRIFRSLGVAYAGPVIWLRGFLLRGEAE